MRPQADSTESESRDTTIRALIRTARNFGNLGNTLVLVYRVCSDLVIPPHNRP